MVQLTRLPIKKVIHERDKHDNWQEIINHTHSITNPETHESQRLQQVVDP